ncbi:Gfo/Idh/MocA family oxidoreductase [Tenacibaculum jejuense]|uniref:UDP-N-acetyl-2-amino-2-deoxy-D-glucuronate oxidase n=1 Tax=Tenacibaculum jejuense TaxID=584609 RepID=A0A238U8S3_9FLAO|nr:Gfo/Idh/MocA family oxidoreductase [Tenacibaculum jejuense]SNR14884.1 UDP-N-acetyl-2-amino-2-deoxy-D-glucuronate oxidase [Tenacibaculum jejuense]
MKNFAILGVAGYIAPRHLMAIKETGNNLLASLDKNDSVGILDSYFPDSSFFVEFERFDRHIEKLKRQEGIQLDYVSVCTPNYLHDSHIRMALRRGADALCEKPLVLNPWNLDALEAIEEESQNRIHAILQLRLHPSVIALKKKVESQKNKTKHEIDLTYITSRGKWYDISWKGDESKSGGIVTNIGIHFFDMLTWIFGNVQESEVYLRDLDKASGYLELENARVRWFLSIDENSLPEEVKVKGQRTFRSITVGGEEIEFSKGFTDLHTKTYEEVLLGNGFSLKDARSSIETVYNIRNAKVVNNGIKHPYL